MHKSKYKELAEKYGLPVAQIQKICESQFEFTKTVIQSPEDMSVRLTHLGKFHVKPGRRAILEANRYEMRKRIKAKNDRRQEASEDGPEGQLPTQD